MSEYQYFVTNFLCPHCESKTPIRKIINEQDGGDLDWFYHIGQCMNQECQKFIMFVYKRDPKGPSVLHPSAPIPVILVHHYSTRSPNMHESIDENAKNSYLEGIQCMDVGANHAAVLMFRRALQDVCIEQNTTEDKLNNQIDEVFPDRMKDAAHEIRLWGNFGAHPDEIIQIVQEEDSIQMKELLDLIFQDIYIMPFKINEAKQKRQGN